MRSEGKTEIIPIRESPLYQTAILGDVGQVFTKFG